MSKTGHRMSHSFQAADLYHRRWLRHNYRMAKKKIPLTGKESYYHKSGEFWETNRFPPGRVCYLASLLHSADTNATSK